MRKMHPMGAKMPFSLNCIKMITQIELIQYLKERRLYVNEYVMESEEM